MARVVSTLVITEAVIAVLLMAGVLIQTPKASGLGGTIGGGGDAGGGGYRTRTGLEGPIYWRTWVLAGRFLRWWVAHARAAWIGLAGSQSPVTPPRPQRGGTAVEALVGAPGTINPLFEGDAS